MMGETGNGCFKADGQCISSLMTIPESFYQRAKGLLGKKYIDKRESMLFYNCSSIHMFGMKFPIDIAYLDNDMRILKLVKNVKPWKLSSCKGANHTIEFSLGIIKEYQLQIGEQLIIKNNMRESLI